MPNKTIILMACICFLALSCHNADKNTQQKKAIPVSVVNITESSTKTILPFSGTLEASKTIDLGFMVSGKIAELYVDKGAYVKKGACIAALVATDYEYALDASKAQYERAGEEFKRLEALYNKNSLTQSDYDKIKALHEEAKADYEYKKKQLNDTRLYAPSAGWISYDNLQVGMIVKQGIPVFRILHTKKICVKFMLPENEISVAKYGKELMFQIPSLGDKEYAAIISQIAPEADQFSRAFEIKAELENADFKLKPGMIAHVEVPAEVEDPGLHVPASAIHYSADGKTYLYIVIDNKATKRRITTRGVSKKDVVLSEGVAVGDKVVVSGTSKLYEGAVVNIIHSDN